MTALEDQQAVLHQRCESFHADLARAQTMLDGEAELAFGYLQTRWDNLMFDLHMFRIRCTNEA